MSINIIHLKQTESTNTYAKDLIKLGNTLPDYTVIIANCQTSGRGRLSREWHSQEGSSLTMSVVLETPLVPAMTLLCGIALSRALNRLTESDGFSLKWPNDVLAENKKVAGILVERFLDFTIIGIGVNVNNNIFPEGIKNKATSLRLLSGKEFDIQALAELTVEALEQVFTEYGYGFSDRAKSEYAALCVNLGKEVRFGENFCQKGIVTDIAADGSLIVKTENGDGCIAAGEVFVSGIY